MQQPPSSPACPGFAQQWPEQPPRPKRDNLFDFRARLYDTPRVLRLLAFTPEQQLRADLEKLTRDALAPSVPPSVKKGETAAHNLRPRIFSSLCGISLDQLPELFGSCLSYVGNELQVLDFSMTWRKPATAFA
jgi:hypothetical protein